jgi:general secretion pathway protein D
MQALESNSMLEFLQQAFGQRSEKLKIKSNPRTNYITLVGLPEDVDAALAIIRELDALNFAGRMVRRYTPRYWDVYELTGELERALTTEGWQVSSNPGQLRPIFLMPVKYSNDIFVFTNSDTADERVATWIREFDRPIEGGDKAQIYIYQVKNVDAVNLVETANGVISKSGNAFVGDSLRAGTSGPGSAPQAGPPSDVFSVDPLGNRIIFAGSPSEYDRYINLLKQLDTPAPEVLIEVQIAEVTLTDNTSFGVEFFLDETNQNASSPDGVSISTGGLGLGAAGATVRILSGNDAQARINAFASNRQVKVLSTPILTARSGETATIQVGTDVPILTSQGVSPVQGIDGSTNIQQNVQYRSTGVLLTIEPIVFSDDRIDLSITQEVSSTLDSSSGGISSPTISNRSLDTSLSLEDGETAVMGDIPLVGKIFSNDSVAVDRTELVILITAYVLRGQSDKTQFTNRLRNRIDSSFSNDDRLVTLLPKNF